MTGVVDRFYEDRGFGYIRSDSLRADLFVHASGVISDHYGNATGWRELHPGDFVEFEVDETLKGPRAVRVTVTEPAPDE